MADSKISALPASTTPLAGTEVLPIVQSSATKQVSVANLTAGRAISATQLTLTTGNLIVASGQGIDFSATSGSGTSELFNDYEEGTFTPVVLGTSVAGAATYVYQLGYYVKTGNVVNFQIILGWSAHTGSGNFQPISGLPYAASNVANKYATMSFYTDSLAMTALNTIQGFIGTNQSAITLRQLPTGGGAAAAIPLGAAVTFLMITGSYQTN